MSLAAGALTQVSVSTNSDSLSSAVATGGTGPYTYQWYRSTITGFSPGGGTLISGATALTLNDSGLVPNTVYFYKVVATDTGNSNVTATSSQLAVTTAAPALSPNVFAMSPFQGMIDQRYDYNTTPVLIDVSQASALYPGAAVKIVDSADGVPKVVGVAANSDDVFGFINFDIKTVQFVAGSPAEVSQSGNVIYLYSTNAIARGARVQLDALGNGVAALSGSSGADIVGWAFDKATAAGQLIRVKLQTPSFLKA